MLRCFREEEEKTRGACKNLFIWIAILSSNDSNGFSSFKIIKAAVLNTVTLSPCSASLSLSLSFRSSDKLQQTVPIIHLFSHSNEKHYKWTRVRLLCCIKALIRIKPYIKTEAVTLTNSSVFKSMRQQQPNIPLSCTILFTNILWVSIGLKLISIIDNATVYNSTGAHATELRGGTFRRAVEAV